MDFGEVGNFLKIERGLNRYKIVSEARAEISRTESRLHLVIDDSDNRAEGSSDHVRFLRALVFFLQSRSTPAGISDDNFQLLHRLAQHLVDRGDLEADSLELFGE